MDVSAPLIVRGERRPDAAELFFSGSGRMSRAPFVATAATLVGLFWLVDLHATGWMRTLGGWLADPVLLFSAACVLSKRLHDLGRAGWWGGPALLAFVLAWPTPRGLAGGCAMAALVGFAGVLALAPGRRGPNRFGP